MLNLIIKDIIIQKKTLLIAPLYTAFAAIGLSSMMPNGLALYVLSPIVIVYLFITTAVAYDDKNKSEIVFNSLPLNGDDIVIAKYISTFAFVIIGIICSVLIGFIGSTAGLPMFPRLISVSDIVSAFTSVCIFSCIFFPVYFKFGVIKMKIFTFILFMLFFFGPIEAINYVLKNPNKDLVQKFNYFINNTSSLALNSLAIMIGLIIFLISLMISIGIYNNKEF